MERVQTKQREPIRFGPLASLKDILAVAEFERKAVEHLITGRFEFIECHFKPFAFLDDQYRSKSSTLFLAVIAWAYARSL